MILDLIIDGALAIFRPLLGLLPTVNLNLPSGGGFATMLGHIDSLVPILDVLNVALLLLSALVVFFTIRIAIVLWHLVIP